MPIQYTPVAPGAPTIGTPTNPFAPPRKYGEGWRAGSSSSSSSSGSGALDYETDLPDYEGPEGDTSYDAPVFDSRGSNALWDSIGAGDFDVEPVDPYSDAFIKNMMSGVTAEGRRAGTLAGNQLLRSQGAGGRQHAALLGMMGESQGLRDAHQLALEEGRFRTGVLGQNADRRLSSLGLQIDADLGAYNAAIDSQRARLAYLGLDQDERLAQFQSGLARRAEERESWGFGQDYRQDEERFDWESEDRDWLTRGREDELAWLREQRDWAREDREDAQIAAGTKQYQIDRLMRDYQNALNRSAYVPGDVFAGAKQAAYLNSLRGQLAALGIQLPEQPDPYRMPHAYKVR